MVEARARPGTDGRRLRGDRTRQRVALRAAERASLYGLDQVSLGQVAADLGISKSGIQAVFGNKEELQLAAVAAATEVFVEHVIAPALSRRRPGLGRLNQLIDGWLRYVSDKVLPGGCFLSATIPEFDSRPGPVRDALAQAKHAWLDVLRAEIAAAYEKGEVAEQLSAELLAFEIDALLSAANTACNLANDPGPLRSVRKILRVRLSPPGG